MKKFGSKLSLSRATLLRMVPAGGLPLVGGGLWSDYAGCTIDCGTDWDSDVVKLREGGGVKK